MGYGAVADGDDNRDVEVMEMRISKRRPRGILRTLLPKREKESFVRGRRKTTASGSRWVLYCTSRRRGVVMCVCVAHFVSSELSLVASIARILPVFLFLSCPIPNFRSSAF